MTTSQIHSASPRLTLATLPPASQLPEGLLHSAPASQERPVETQVLGGDGLLVPGCQPLMERVRSTTHGDKPCGAPPPVSFFGRWMRECLHLPYGKADLLPTHVNYGRITGS